MTRLRAGRKLDALDAKIAALEAERRQLEIRALGVELTDPERRNRYFGIPDLALRRKAIELSRALHQLREQQPAATVDYWSSVVDETRGKLADLTSDSPTSGWRRAIWWDALTVLWIFAGAGWLYRKLPGALAGTVIAAAWAWFIVRARKRTRLTYIREGENMLHSSESELHQAQRHAARTATSQTLFSAAEEETGIADDGARATVGAARDH